MLYLITYDLLCLIIIIIKTCETCNKTIKIKLYNKIIILVYYYLYEL